MREAATLTSGSDERIGRIGRIPVRNLWLLMLYASDLFRDLEKSKVAVEDNPDDIPDLVIEDQDVIRKILSHLGLWEKAPRPPPPQSTPALVLDSSLSQLPPWEDDLNQDPGLPIEWSA